VLGAAAPRPRPPEARAAAAAQLERQRTLLHNHASVLSLLSQDIDDPRLRDSAMGAAARGARQIHALLADGATLPRRDASGDVYLRSLADEVCEEFTDLPLIKNLDLLGACTVPEPACEPLVEGLRTLLWNVREHSGAGRVTVHGEVRPDGGWTLTVSDDGKGFEPETVPRGFGLRVQAGSALARVGVAVTVDTAPGEGTRVQLSSAAPA
jgi:signal transduction histidine kinase